MDHNTSETFVPVKRIVALIDLAGCAKAFQSDGDSKMAKLLQDYYAACENIVSRNGGTVIKFMGDGCLAVFQPNDAAKAVDAVRELRDFIRILANRSQVAISLGANVHMTDVIDAEFGAGDSKRRDILGRGVNQTFLLGRGPGVRISEPVYRALPSSARSPWNKHKPPAIYHLDNAEGILEGLGKSPAANIDRW